MFRNFAKIFFLMAAFLMLPNFAWAAPSITFAPASISNGEVITVGGSGFGTKVNIAPKYFNTLENETLGQVPSDQILTNVNRQGTVKNNLSHDGVNSLEWDYCADQKPGTWSSANSYIPTNLVTYNNVIYNVTASVGPSGVTPDVDSAHFSVYAPYVIWSSQGVYTSGQIIYQSGPNAFYLVTADVGPNSDPADGVHFTATLPGSHCPPGKFRQGDWQRNIIDLGVSGSDKVLVSFWLYLDKGTSTSLSWQWKNVFITSNSAYYYTLGPTESTLGFEPWYFANNRWGNTGAPNLYYWDYTATPAKYALGLNLSAPNDMYLFNQWQRVELYAQRSSVGGASDGIVNFNRIGRLTPIANRTNVVTHVEGDYPWRYVDLSNAIESVSDGYVDFKVYMDDIYVDTTQARVEICDSATWAARSHCEIQIPQNSWTDSQLEIKVNRGTFATNSSAYLYVVDPNGNVNASGYAINFVSADTTAPAAPTNLSVL
jgi:hypothetical protein